jgi:hypothetical protein
MHSGSLCTTCITFYVLLTYKSWFKWTLNKQAETYAKATETVLVTGLVTVSKQTCKVRLPTSDTPFARVVLAERTHAQMKKWPPRLQKPKVKFGNQKTRSLDLARAWPLLYLNTCSFRNCLRQLPNLPPPAKTLFLTNLQTTFCYSSLPRGVLRIPPTWSSSM